LDTDIRRRRLLADLVRPPAEASGIVVLITTLSIVSGRRFVPGGAPSYSQELEDDFRALDVAARRAPRSHGLTSAADTPAADRHECAGGV
jgi:hypothetical protein